MVYVVQNKEDLDKKIAEAGDKVVVIDFFANWCGPCKIISPKLEELSLQYNEKAMVLKVDVDDCEEIAHEYNVTSMPTFVFLKNNHIIDVFVGGNSERLVKSMEKYVGGESATSSTENVHDNAIPTEQEQNGAQVQGQEAGPAPIDAVVENVEQLPQPVEGQQMLE